MSDETRPTVYYSSITATVQMEKRQQKIFMILDGKKIPYNKVDVCGDSSNKERMRNIVGDSKALPPQICHGDVYCGDFTAFENAVEENALGSFLNGGLQQCM